MLIILDINGILCCKVKKNIVVDELLDCLDLQSYKVILRPGVREFLDYCYKNYDVAFFSSTTYKNANVILNKLLNEEQNKLTKFRWFRDRTHLDLDYGDNAEITEFDTIKILDDVFTNPIVNAKRIYSPKNTIIIDDSKNKMRFNPKRNVVIVKAYTGNVDDNELQATKSTIIDFFADL